MDIEELMGESPNKGDKKNQESPLLSLKKDLELYHESIREVAIEIMVEGLSAYPIFVAHQHQITLGEPILDNHELGTDWTIHASTLEEFIDKGIIKTSKKEAFIKSFKDASDYACLFVVVPEGANFVYFPYHKNNVKTP
ncbi:MAG: hypothetical protein EAZ51_09750 [Sphingobacteriales bacterium]|nr:MAG: hypothetical protein EAZ64_01165 [Sphingobacteriales bacterium]TAF78311.1 MAG: hypothetical protein EAZ51_09750 [Sphingobacteriales bacterium]